MSSVMLTKVLPKVLPGRVKNPVRSQLSLDQNLDEVVSREVATTLSQNHTNSQHVSLRSEKVRSTLPVQIAACRSLAQIGLSKKTLDEIRILSDASERWVSCLQHFISNPDTAVLFPDGVPQIRSIHKLALFHDKPIRPPRRFICSSFTSFPKRRTPIVYRDALAQHRKTGLGLAQFMNWIDMESLPINQESLELLDCILSEDSLDRYTGQNRRAIAWYEGYMSPNVTVNELLANGQMKKLREEVAAAIRFADHVHFQRSLGPAFKGIDTNWKALHAYIEFSQSIHDVVQNLNVACNLVTNWRTRCERFYALARRASVASKRITKLNKLVKRMTAEHPGQAALANTLSANSSPSDLAVQIDDPAVYLSAARNASERLSLWTNVLSSGQNNGNLTPCEILSLLKP